MRRTPFVKAVASGNDFVIVDNRKAQKVGWSHFAKRVCRRKTGIGADGLLLLEDSDKADIKMRVFNPDGSEVEMCGNGARCVALYYSCQLSVSPSPRLRRTGVSCQIKIETKAGVLQAEFSSENRVKVKMTDPKDLKIGLDINLNEKNCKVHYINTGVPHVILFVEDIDDFNVKEIGNLIRYHGNFQPAGTNADFVKFLDKNSIAIRTYERGVEDETFACGTGACASAVVSSVVRGALSPIDVHARSDEVLKVYFEKDKDNVKNLYLEGEARIVYEGKIRPDS